MSPFSSQKTSAVLVSSVCSLFYPETYVVACEVDACGFDLVLKSSCELSDSAFLVLQEEVRRQKGKASIRSYSMMLRVLKAYVAKEKKRLGPCQDIPENALVDICEVNGYCAVVPGPHEEEGSSLGDITLIGYTCFHEVDGWLWHIRGVSYVGKKSNTMCATQKMVWEHNAQNVLEGQHALSKMVFLPQGVQCKKKLLSWLTFQNNEWIEEASQELMKVASDEELMNKAVRSKQRFNELRLHSAYETIHTLRKVQYRVPLGWMTHQTALVQYVFDPTGPMLGGISALFHQIQLPCTITITSSNKTACQRLHDMIRPELFSDMLVEYDVLSGPFSYITLHGHHADGRLVPLSSYVMDSNRKEVLVAILALSLERWLGLLTEWCGTLPPFFIKNRVAILLIDDIRSCSTCVEMEKQLSQKGIEFEFLTCRPSDIAKKRVELKQKGVHYVAVVGAKEVQAQSFLLYTGSCKKGYTCTFNELSGFFEALPTRQCLELNSQKLKQES